MQQMWIAARRKHKRGRQAAILAASILFHIMLFLVAFSRASGALVSAGEAGGGPTGSVFAVSLVRLASAEPSQENAATAASTTPLRIRPTPRLDGVPMAIAPEQSPFAALAERLTTPERSASNAARRVAAEHAQLQGAYVPNETKLSDARGQKALSDSGLDGATRGAASTGNLWGAIEPCWRNLSFRGQAPVTIDVAIDSHGMLRGPPRVVRGETALLNEPRLRSEANALAALAACLPRRDLRFAGAQFRVEFPSTP